MAEGKDLLSVLWSGADVLRGKMDANEYKTYLLGLVFYKYLSDSYLAKVYDLLNDENPESLEEAQRVYEEVMESDDANELLDEIKESKHYTLDPDMTYISMLHAAKNNSFNRDCNPAKNLCWPMWGIEFSCLFTSFRCKLAYQILIGIAKNISLCMDNIHAIQYFDDLCNRSTLFLISCTKPIGI